MSLQLAQAREAAGSGRSVQGRHGHRRTGDWPRAYRIVSAGNPKRRAGPSPEALFRTRTRALCDREGGARTHSVRSAQPSARSAVFTSRPDYLPECADLPRAGCAAADFRLSLFALRPNGFLFLGTAEPADAADDLFVVVDKKWRIYRARTVAHCSKPAEGFPPLFQQEATSADERTPPVVPLPTPASPVQRSFSFTELH